VISIVERRTEAVRTDLVGEIVEPVDLSQFPDGHAFVRFWTGGALPSAKAYYKAKVRLVERRDNRLLVTLERLDNGAIYEDAWLSWITVRREGR